VQRFWVCGIRVAAILLLAACRAGMAVANRVQPNVEAEAA
jgi:hypothetical protein